MGRAADLYGNVAVNPQVTPASGTDVGDNGDEAIESDDDGESGSEGTSHRDPVWT